jgi:RNA polymerase sigma-70 factor (ECF subfamily)
VEELPFNGDLAGGDREAWQRLVEHETPTVFRTCYRILGRVEEAEDATQETFLAAYRSIGSFRGDGPARAWLTRIATRESWQRAARYRKLSAISSSLDNDDTPPLGDQGGGDPLGDTLSAEAREQIRQAVARLPEPYREVVTLRYLGELSIAEIAEATGRRDGTVKAQLHRGLERLRREMATLVPG